MARMLIIEDEKQLVKLLAYNLEHDGHEVVSATDGASGLEMAIREKPDLVLLDLMLPKLDGMDVCRTLRKISHVPILMLSARKEEIDRIIGLEIGADDYLTKPFGVRELLARVKALLRRARHSGPPPRAVRLGDLNVDLDRYIATLDGKALSLSAREFQLLKILIEADGKALSRDQFLEKIWGYDQSYEIDTRTIDQHVARLRMKLGAEAERIVTVKNIGYRLETAS
jgi:two-component system, OmpR family, alkaline phosphatase synthesis response regulator PhoP